MNIKKIVVLIPAYEPTWAMVELADSLLEADYEVVVVNDGSGADYDTVFLALPEKVHYLSHEQNRGKGCALKTGLTYISKELSDCAGVITADADGQHELHDIIHVSEVMLKEPGKLILGSRDFHGDIPLKSRLGNSITRWVFARLSGVKVFDTQTGLRGFTMDMISELLTLPGDRYEYEINMLIWATRQRIPILEIPIKTVYIEDNATSNFKPLADSIRIYSSILKFGFSSFASFLIDFAALLIFRAIFSNLPDAQALLYAIICARAISSFCNFLMNKQIVFQSGERFIVALVKYYILVIIILAANAGMMHLLNIVLLIPLWISKIITEVILFFLSYFVQKKHIFKHKTKKFIQ